jgi:ribosomal protein S12 methylthiotransferase
VAQDLASYGRDAGSPGALAPLLHSLDALSGDGLARVRLLYLYPSQVRDPLVGAILDLETPVPYFDLSLQHASEPLLKRMRRWGSGERFLAMIDGIRRREPAAAFRSSFIVGFPGETEDDHEELLGFLEAAGLDWAGLFPFSPEDGTPAAAMDGAVDDDVVKERLDELSVVQDRLTQAARDALVGSMVEVLVDGNEGGVPVGRTHREAPEIDGVVRFAAKDSARLVPGTIVTAEVTAAVGPDLEAKAA